ncbi:MAG: AlkA N-terminal domain-containing protein [Pseudomonadota bacterium]
MRDETVRVPYRKPLSWEGVLGFFSFRATPGVEAVVDGRYCRTISTANGVGWLAAEPAGDGASLAVTAHGVPPDDLSEVVRRVSVIFDVDAPIERIRRRLGADAVLLPRLKRLPGVRVMGAWSGFELTVRAILGQQISVAAATTLAGRVAERYGEPLSPPEAWSGLTRLFPTPARLARAHFNNMGLIGSRIATIKAVSKAVAAGELSFHPDQDVTEFCDRFTAIKGIGDWTAQYVAMRVLRDPDAFPSSDLGLMKAVEPGTRLTPAELAARAEHWRPWRAYAASLLWYGAAGSGG